MKLFKFKQPPQAMLVLPVQQTTPQHLRGTIEHEQEFTDAITAWGVFSTIMWGTVIGLAALTMLVFFEMVFSPSVQ